LDDIYYEKTLNRIIQGRLRINLGDLVLFIYEPSLDILEESFEIYEEAKKKAYFSGNFLEQDVLEILLEGEMWSPHDDKAADSMDEKIEELKIHAFKNFYKKKELRGIKKNIRNMERKQALLRLKKTQLNHITCDGAADFSRKCWIVEKTTKTINNLPFNFNDYSLSFVLEKYQSNSISSEQYRKIARSAQWRAMWSSSKQRGDVFGKPSIELDQQQLSLIQFSMMYDNVFENPESPKEEIINDDDCLDGWFIHQRRKHEKSKKQAEVDAMLGNSKVANSQEIFLMADDKKEAEDVYSLNSINSRNIIPRRQKQLENTEGLLNFKDLREVQQDRMMNAVTSGAKAIKGKG
jgi:hypothetical protein